MGLRDSGVCGAWLVVSEVCLVVLVVSGVSQLFG